MKKLLAILLALFLVVPAVDAANVAKQLEKARNKEMKAKLKEYKKEGWKVFGTSHTIEVALLSHYDRLAQLGEDGYEQAGIASNFKSKNVGKQMAANAALTDYAQKAGSSLKGRIVSDMKGDGTEGIAEFENFYAAYERLVEKEIKNELTESYSVIRELGNGNYEMQTFYIVSESAAVKARMRAMEDAMKESALAQKHAAQISDFVRQGFEQ